MNLRKMKKRQAREARGDAYVPQAAPTLEPEPVAVERAPDAVPGVEPTPETGAAEDADGGDDADFAERSEIVELMYRAALTRAEAAEAKERDAEARAAEVEARQQAIDERAAAIDSRVAAIEDLERFATERAAAAEALERAAAERAAAAEARELAIAQRLAAAEAREAVVTERDSIANARDRGAMERDAIANARDKAAIEREAFAREALVREPGGRSRAGDRQESAEEQDEALERARLEAELQRAHLDGLTGAFRREMGRLALRNEIDRARRSDGKFVIAYIDVDGLKGVNDRNGHAAGDRVLRMLVATMRANLRSYDPIVRFGGDEFVCGIASIDPGEVQHRIGVIDQSLRHSTGVGITAGLAELTPSESLDDLTARADAALIAAKQSRTDELPPA